MVRSVCVKRNKPSNKPSYPPLKKKSKKKKSRILVASFPASPPPRAACRQVRLRWSPNPPSHLRHRRRKSPFGGWQPPREGGEGVAPLSLAPQAPQNPSRAAAAASSEPRHRGAAGTGRAALRLCPAAVISMAKKKWFGFYKTLRKTNKRLFSVTWSCRFFYFFFF